MKKLYELISKVLIVMLVAIIPLVSIAQTKTTPTTTKKTTPTTTTTKTTTTTTTTKEEPKKADTKATTDQVKKNNKAPTHTYWGVTGYIGGTQFNGDLSKNLFLNDKWMFGAGGMVTRQFTRVIGARLKIGWTPVSGGVDGKYVPNAGLVEPLTGFKGDNISQRFTSYIIESDLSVTINWVNWIMGYKPERFFSSYLIAGLGFDHTQGRKWDSKADTILGYLGYPTHKGSDDPLRYGNNSGLGHWNGEFKLDAGIGFDFNLSQHWSINPEILWRWRDGDVLDMTTGGVKEIKNDMFSGAYVGLTYKFCYGGCSLTFMQKNYPMVKFETTPAVMVERGDSVTVTVKGTFPEKYFCPKAAMYFQPVLKYEGGSYALKPITIMGEKVSGNGTQIKYREGGSFTYTTTFPYKPEMATSELTISPIIYEPKDYKAIPKKDDIKTKGKFQELAFRDLAPGIIHTDKRIMTDMIPTLADHGYVKEVIISKVGVLYFKVNVYKLDLKFGINKSKAAQDALTGLNDFIKSSWKLKNVTIDGWASPEGEETLNVGLSENRSKTGNEYVIDQYKAWEKAAQKDNKDKKDVKAKVEAAGKDVSFVLNHHGPDWNGFLANVKASNLKDKDKILNVINSAGDEKKKEQEIRNMIVIYPDLEKELLPPLRRAEITANAFEKKLTDDELLKMAVSNPENLKVEELLYAGTLTTNPDTKLTIYENAARLFPNNWKTLNNAGNASIAKGNLDKAANYLQKAQAIAANNGIIENNIGVVAAKKNDYKKAEDQFKKAQSLGENENYNLGVLMIPKGEYSKANTMLANAKCTYNLGLAQVVSGNNTAAITTLQCAPQTPETAYLLAVCGARTANTKMLYDNLAKAVVDPKLMADAKGDREFFNYANTQDFKNIVK
jgi:tetratricopeptide (TPR) repeat protein/outer membrane protein OmpA-like peptidoglycan-associated protein